jgi:serine/threonine protein phosphatase PrpC
MFINRKNKFTFFVVGDSNAILFEDGKFTIENRGT